MRKLVLALALALSCTTAGAKATPKKISIAETSPTELVVLIEKMRDATAKQPNAVKRSAFSADIDRLLETVRATPDFAALKEKDRIAIANQYESLRARADGGAAKQDRRICAREVRVGSHLGTTVCRTQAEIDRAQALSADELRQTQNKRPGASGD
jgi:hypothetical protein